MISAKNLLRVTPLAFSLVVASNLQAVMISRSSLASRVREEAQSYLSSQGHSVPQRIQAEYNGKLDDATQRLYNRLDREGRSYADGEEIKSSVRDVMQNFISTTLKTLVPRNRLNNETRTIIRRVAEQEGINPNNIPSSMTTEYNSRTEKIIDSMRRTMSNDGRDYVRVHEVESETKKEMKALFARIKREQQSSGSSWSNNSNNSGNSNNWFDWSDFFGSSNNGSNSSTSSSSSNVSSYQLENKVAELANDALREKGYSEATIPARVVSDYADKVQAVIRQMKQKMNDWGTTSVSVSDIKSALRNQLEPIFNALTYKGESCSICLDEYERNDRVGYLKCNHFFHNDCIKTWLEKQRSCPLCRASSYSVQNTELVP